MKVKADLNRATYAHLGAPQPSRQVKRRAALKDRKAEAATAKRGAVKARRERRVAL
jgi:hypothetical protein